MMGKAMGEGSGKYGGRGDEETVEVNPQWVKKMKEKGGKMKAGKSFR